MKYTIIMQTVGLIYFINNLDNYIKKQPQITPNFDNTIRIKQYPIYSTKQSKNFVRN